MAITSDEVRDLIDTYGGNREKWPALSKVHMERLIRQDSELADYVAEARKLDELLSKMEDDEDGAEVEDDEKEPEDEIDEEEPDEDEDESEDDDFESPKFEIDADDLEELSDMDEMFARVITSEMSKINVDTWLPWTRENDKIVEFDVPTSTPMTGIDTAVSKAAGPLMKDLRRMMAAKTQVKKQPGMRRGKLHAPNLHRVISGDDRVFFRKETATELDTAVSLLIDCSGSMQGSEYSLAIQASYALGMVLARLGIPFECLGFTDDRKHPSVEEDMKQAGAAHQRGETVHRVLPLVMPRYKTFDERWTPDVQRRFGWAYNCNGNHVAPGVSWGATPEGCANEFAARRLLRRPEQRKILITMTDGAPGISMPTSEDRNFMHNMQICQSWSTKVVKMIEAAGVDLIGIGIKCDNPTSYYTNAIVINDVEEMPRELIGLMRKLLIGK